VSISLDMAVFKSIIVDLNYGDKLSKKNYNVWYRKIEYLLKKQEMLKIITQPMVEPEQGNMLNTSLIWKHIKPISTRIV